jgi:hypothetical protein
MNKYAWTGVGLSALLLALPAVRAQTPADQNQWANSPDKVAWTQFIAVNAAAAALNNAFFETWASDGDTFRTTPRFPSGPTPVTFKPRALLLADLLSQQQPRGIAPQIVQPPAGDDGSQGIEETRRNFSTWDFIRKNNLYKVSGLIDAFNNGVLIDFPIDSMEVKANWFPVRSPQDPSKSGIPGYDGNPDLAAQLYHVNTATDQKQYALVSMHVISKLVPNWTWATFEHKNNPGRCDYNGCRDKFGAQQAVVPANPQLNGQYPDCTKSAALKELFAGARWDKAFENYCLKGTQVDFADRTGLATQLGNSVTEAGFADRASCLTCHGRAAFGGDGKRTSVAGFDIVNGQVVAPFGPINGTWYWVGPSSSQSIPITNPPNLRVALSTDFIWSIPHCAIDDTANPPETESPRCKAR